MTKFFTINRLVNYQKRYLALLTFLAFATASFAEANLMQQQIPIEITGSVKSADDNDVLPGVYVQEKGTSNGTITDLNGNFRIKVNEGAVLVFKMVGFVSTEVKTDERTTYSVTIKRDLKALDEVMVIGYGSKNKSTFAGSAVTLNAEDLNKSSLSVANQLQGRVSGVQVTQNNGTPGAGLSVRIRGTNSINADSEPLYVIDGFPTNNGIGFSVNPEDIESISILKDASTTAIYGARGANGVVLITTKSGKNQKSSINVNASRGYQNVTQRFDLASPYDHGVRLNALLVRDGQLPAYSDSRLDTLRRGIIGTDWQDELYRTAKVDNYSINFTGSNKSTSVYSSLDYLDQEGVVIKSQYNRIGARVNVDHAISDKFKLSARAFGYYGKQNDLPLSPSSINGFVKQVIKANPASQFDSGVSAVRDGQNPLHFLAATDRENNLYRTNAYFSFSYEPIKRLIFKADAGSDFNISKFFYFAPSTVPAGVASNGTGSITDVQETELIFNPTVRYSFAKSENNFEFLVGYNAQNYSYFENGTNASNFSGNELGYNNLGIAQQFSGYSGKTVIRRRSWFGRIDYDYKNKYIFTGTYRIDGSSVFGENNKLGYFPSAAVAWNFTEEDFVKDLGLFSSGKARLSYGITGNDRISAGLSLVSFSGNNSTKYTFDGVTAVSGIAAIRNGNPNLRWEETGALDVGLSLGFLKNRIIVEADYYKKRTKDLLLDENTAPSIGYTTFFGNAGETENSGFEFSLQTTNISKKDFTWASTLTFATNKNRVLSLGKANSDIYLANIKPDGAAGFEQPFIIRVGQPLGTFFGYVYDGIIQENDPVLSTTHPNAEAGDPKFVDVNEDGILDSDDRVILGTSIPKGVFGFTNNFTYKGFNLDIVTQGQFGGNLLNLQKADMLNPLSQGNVFNEVINNTWSPENPSGTVPANSFYGTAHGGWANSRFIESSDYFRVKNVTLGYNFNVSKLKSVGITGINVFVNVQNLFTITNYTGLDPEVANLVDNVQQNKNAARGIDFNAYPVNRMFLMGTRIRF